MRSPSKLEMDSRKTMREGSAVHSRRNDRMSRGRCSSFAQLWITAVCVVLQLFSNGMRESEEKELVIKINVKGRPFSGDPMSLTFREVSDITFGTLEKERERGDREGVPK